MIRFILVVVALLGFLAASIPLVIGEYLVSKRNAKRQQEHSLRIVQAMFRLIFRLTGSTLTIKGQDNVPEGAVLYVGILILLWVMRWFQIWQDLWPKRR